MLKSVQFVEDAENPKDWQFELRVMKPGRFIPGTEPEEHKNYVRAQGSKQAEGAQGPSNKSTKSKKEVTSKVPRKGLSNEGNASAKGTSQAKGKRKTTVEEEVPSKSTTVNAKKKTKPVKSVTAKATTQAKGKRKTTVESEEVPSKSTTVNAKKSAEPVKSVTTKIGTYVLRSVNAYCLN